MSYKLILICEEMKKLKTEWMKETGEEVSLEEEDKLIEVSRQ